jgi:hypothetical protein
MINKFSALALLALLPTLLLTACDVEPPSFVNLNPGSTTATGGAVNTRLRLPARYLAKNGISFAFNRSASTYATAFYTMGSLASVPADASHMIQRSRIKDMFLFGTQSFSIAYNKNENTASANYFPIRQQVPFFYDHAPPACNGAVPAPNTTPNSSTTAFPYGFEVMITGPASGRNVLMRVSSVARSYNSFVSHADMLTTYARDL